MGGCSAHNACVVLPGRRRTTTSGARAGATRPSRRTSSAPSASCACAGSPPRSSRPGTAPSREAAGADAIVHPVNAVGGVRWNAAFAYLDPARGRDEPDHRGRHARRPRPARRRPRRRRRDERWRAARRDRRARGRRLRLAGDPAAQRHRPAARAAGRRGADRPRRRRLRLRGHRPPAARDGGVRARRGRCTWRRSPIQARSSACAAGVCDLFFFPAIDPPGAAGYEVSVAVFAMKPDSRGTVRLTSPDPRAPLAIDHGFLSDERDVAVLVEGVEALRGSLAATSIRAYAGREARPGPEVDAERPRARGRARVLPPGRHVRDRPRWSTATAASTGSTACRRRRLDHAVDPARQHEPEHDRAGRAPGRADAGGQLTSRSSGHTTRSTRANAPRCRRSGVSHAVCRQGSSGTPSFAAGAPASASSR